MGTSSPGVRRNTSNLSLRKAQSLVLSKPSRNQWIDIDIKEGLLRVSTSHENEQGDVTMAIMSPMECGKFRYPKSCQLSIEALADTNLSICFDAEHEHLDDDFLSDWLLALHFVRNPAKAEDRLLALLRLLSERFGKRTSEGFQLEFLLPHARIAEIIGATRSTVSRTLSAMRKDQQIAIDELRETVVIFLSD